jgi:mannose-6-phosphate isomerase-like protein (cupin superfamily)
MTTKVAPKAEVFDLKAPYLSQGRYDRSIARSDHLWLRVKVYAEGGENALHTHTTQDHSFVVLEGQATFYDENDNARVVGKYEGIMLPAGAFYRFQSSGDINLVMLRCAGFLAEQPGGNDRVKLDGSPIPGGSADNKHIEGVPVPGEFFGG